MTREECPLRTPCGLCSVEKHPCDVICGVVTSQDNKPSKKTVAKKELYEPMSMDIADLMYKKRHGIA